MANIREFDTPQLGIQPSELGVEATAAAARRGGAFFNQAAEDMTGLGSRVGSAIKVAGDTYLKYEDHKQISQGAATASDMFANLEKQWNDIKKAPGFDPNNDSVGTQFKEQVLQPALDKFAANFTTENSQAFAEGIVNKYRQHFTTKVGADMSEMAGIAAKENATKTINSLSSAVYLDPSSLDTAIDTLKHSAGHIVDSSPTIDAETGARIKSELSQKGVESLVKSAVSGMIEKNPGINLDAIQKKYGAYINGPELKMFQKAAQTQAKANALVEKQTAVAARQLADLQVHQGATKVITDNVTFDQQNGQPIVNPRFFKDALDLAKKNPDAPSAAATVRTMLDWGESQQNKERKVVDDPSVIKDLTDRMFDPNKPTTRRDLMQAQIAGKMSDHTFATMSRNVEELEQSPLKGPVWQATAAAAKDALIVTIPGMPGKDTKGNEAYASFMQSFIPQYLAKSRAGTLEPNALDLKDSNSMISKAMAPFKRTAAQRMQDWTANIGGLGAKPAERNDVMPAVPPPDQRQPGLYETPKGKMRWTGTGWVQP